MNKARLAKIFETAGAIADMAAPMAGEYAPEVLGAASIAKAIAVAIGSGATTVPEILAMFVEPPDVRLKWHAQDSDTTSAETPSSKAAAKGTTK